MNRSVDGRCPRATAASTSGPGSTGSWTTSRRTADNLGCRGMSVRAWVLLATCSTCWGLPYLLIKLLVEDGVPVGVVAFARVVVGALVLLPFAWRGLAALRGRWRAVVVLALL